MTLFFQSVLNREKLSGLFTNSCVSLTMGLSEPWNVTTYKQLSPFNTTKVLLRLQQYIDCEQHVR